MDLNVTRDGENVCFQVKGRIDEMGAEEMKRRFNELPLNSIKMVDFDFSKVSHIGSAGLGKLLLFYKTAKQNGGTIRISGASRSIFDLLMELELNQIFTISR